MAAKRQLIKRRVDIKEGIRFESLYDEFILSRKGQIAPATIKYYQWNLRALRDYMVNREIAHINQLGPAEFDGFMGYLLDKYTNKTTINAYLRAARAVLNYAMKEGYVQKYEIRLIKEAQKTLEVYTNKELSKLFRTPKNINKIDFTEYRNWVLVQYFSETGNRLNSVINLQVRDVDFELRQVKVRVTKNKKVNYSPISQTMVKILNNYVQTWGLQEDDYLFPNSERMQLTKDAISKSIARYNRSRGVNKTSIHLFRHTMATNFIRDNGDISALQRLLAHSSIMVTNRYVNFCREDLLNEVDKHSLVEKIRRPRISRRD